MLNTQVVPGIHIRKIILKRSARFIKHQYSREPGLVTIILKDLKLPTLEIRRKIKRLCLFHKVFPSSGSDKHPILYKTTK